MKCLAAVLLAGLCCLALAAQRGRVPAAGAARFWAPSVVMKMYHVPVSRPERIQNPAHVVRDEHHIQWPQHDERGAPIRDLAGGASPGAQSSRAGRQSGFSLASALSLAAILPSGLASCN